MASFNYPATIDKDTPAVASEVQTNFDDLLAWVLANLIQRDGSVVMTGPLVLAPGAPAAPEHAANKAYVDATIPIGVMWEYGGTSLPSGWLWCNGDTYTDTSQPALAAAIGRSFTDAGVPAGSFQVPDKRKRVSMGFDATDVAFALGKKGGQRDAELLQHLHSVPAHSHGATAAPGDTNHVHSLGQDGGLAATAGSHTHVASNGGSFQAAQAATGYNLSPTGNAAVGGATIVAAGDHSHALTGYTSGYSANHSHAVTIADAAAFNTVNQGAGTTLVDKNLPPYLVVNHIIYAGS
jgi:microcystin-dependent protein